jgi:nucleoid-associated protein YgaU
MSKDYKIGVVFGLALLITVGVYYSFFRGDAPTDGPTTQPAPEEPDKPGVTFGTSETAVADETDDGEDLADLPRLPAPGGGGSSGSSAADSWNLPSEPDNTKDDDDIVVVRPALDNRRAGPTRWEVDPESDAEEPAAPASPEGTDAPSAQPAPAGGGFQIDPDADRAVREPDPILQRVDRPEPVELGEEAVYTVQKGDLGFWYIAAKVYDGKGHLWTRIRDANPGVDTNALRPGMKLKIPPPPQTAAPAEPPAPAEQRGKVTQNPSTGQRFYVVSEDDKAGFWGIAQKVYGKGHLWPLIHKANLAKVPNPHRLPPGTRLVIPPVPDSTSTAPSTTGTATTDRRNLRGRTYTRDGKKFYVVDEGDAGFWGIAEKVYGQGKYASRIRDANPGVDSGNLQPGDRLVIPPLTAADTQPGRSAPRRSTPRRSAPRTTPPPTGEPDFGP